jgi:hypothetical protein
MNPIAKHPIESVKYLARIVGPTVEFYSLMSQYNLSGNKDLVEPIEKVGDEMKGIIRKHYAIIAPERIASIVGELEKELALLKK